MPGNFCSTCLAWEIEKVATVSESRELNKGIWFCMLGIFLLNPFSDKSAGNLQSYGSRHGKLY
jgi:hypothetical protein